MGPPNPSRETLRCERGQGNMFPSCSADHERGWQPYPVDPYSVMCDDHTYIERLAMDVREPPGSDWKDLSSQVRPQLPSR